MKKITLIVFVVISLFAGNLTAQVLDEPQEGPRDSFYEKISFNNRKPFVFPYVRQADVVWEWRVWRVIDFREKLNQVFYYPVQPEQGRVNLFYALEQAINEGKIKVYRDDEFKEEINWAEVKLNLGTKRTTEVDSIDIDGTEMRVEKEVFIPLNSEDIKTLRIKENWFIDKQRSVQDVRIAGFAPIYYQVKEEGAAPITIPLFWVRYDDPEVRELLANTEVYNPRNDAQRRSYDDIFLKRLFSSYIMRESSRYGDRTISQYTTGEESLAESDLIRDKIYDMEEDMWEY
jgi:gliding motility associated protien GldN